MATPSEMCFTPQVTKDPVIVSFNDRAYFAFPDLLSTKSCNASMCRDLLLGIRYTCWTANDVEKAYIGSKKLNERWSSWIKYPLTPAENGPCLSLLPVPFLWHRFCLIQYHVGPSQTFKKEPIKVDSQKVCMKHMGGGLFISLCAHMLVLYVYINVCFARLSFTWPTITLVLCLEHVSHIIMYNGFIGIKQYTCISTYSKSPVNHLQRTLNVASVVCNVHCNFSLQRVWKCPS
jgi:hypothetical protein